jgi:hypothetical protein
MSDPHASTGRRTSSRRAKAFVSFMRLFGPGIMFAVLLASIIPGRFVLTESGAARHWALRYVAIPGSIVYLSVALALGREFLARCKFKINYWLFLVFGPFLIVYVGTGAAIAANMLIPPQTNFILTGTVVQKYVSHGRSTDWWTLEVETDTGSKEFLVTQPDFDRARIGHVFSQERMMGPLGFSYTRRP